MILDKLVEKKDLMAYINFRLKVLVENMNQIPKKEVPSRRHIAMTKIRGRIEELIYLRRCVALGIKKSSINTAYSLGKLRPRKGPKADL